VLLLDLASWRLDDVSGNPITDSDYWEPEEEILRIETIVRKKLGIPAKTGNIAQPWIDRQPAPTIAYLSLRFLVDIPYYLTDAHLALEDAEENTILIDGEKISKKIDSYWVDEAIKKVALPALSVGRHEIAIKIPFNRKSNVECLYLLGKFGVEVHGRHSRIIDPVRFLTFGDWTTQGLPFYSGNVTYHLMIQCDGSALSLRCPLFKAALLSVELDGAPAADIAFDPYRVDLGSPTEGERLLDITAYGNRFNSFGQLHLVDDPKYVNYGPDSWRTGGVRWSYEYQLKPMGILSAPIIERKN
jgi:hypothetical protein